MGASNSQLQDDHTVRSNSPTKTDKSLSIDTDERPKLRNILVVWVDSKIDECDRDAEYRMSHLQQQVGDVVSLIGTDTCLHFLKSVHNKKVLLITSGTLGKALIPQIHSLAQVDTIYILCNNRVYHEEWVKPWNKIRDIYENIEPLGQAIRLAINEYNEDSILMSFHSSNSTSSINESNSSEFPFIYTALLKKILVDIEHDDKARNDLVSYYRDKFHIDPCESNVLDEFQSSYQPHEAIRWYTRDCFLSHMVNRAIRFFEADLILRVGFFIRDLHRQVMVLHQKQSDQYHGKSFSVYRGQGLSMSEFEKLQKYQGEYVAFNSFIATSKIRTSSLAYAERMAEKDGTIGILFVMTIDASVNAAPFVDLQGLSYDPSEHQVLFSIHSVFHIREIKPLNSHSTLFEVSLSLISNEDERSSSLTQKISTESQNLIGWKSLGHLLIKLGLLREAQELYGTLLEQTVSQEDQGYYYHQLGVIKDQQEQYAEAIYYYEQSLAIKETILCPTDPSLAASYNNLGAVYENIGNYSAAFRYYEKTVEIEKQILSPNDPNLAVSYDNLGNACDRLERYSDALVFYRKALSIYRSMLPPNHLQLAAAYKNLGGVYHGMQKLNKALSHYCLALKIWQKLFPSIHSDLAHLYNDIGLVYDDLGEHAEALLYYDRALRIQEQNLPQTHSDIATTYNNIGAAYYELKKYRKALHYFHKALKIRKKVRPLSHPDVQDSMRWVERVHHKLSNTSVSVPYNDDR